MNLKAFAVLALAAVISIPAFAADDEKQKKKKKGNRGQNSAAGQLLKQLEDVGLTDDQVAKVKELGKEVAAKIKKIKDDAGITNELTKKRQEIAKAMKDSEKKGQELAKAINKEAGFTEAHAKALQVANEVRMEFHKAVVSMLTMGRRRSCQNVCNGSPSRKKARRQAEKVKAREPMQRRKNRLLQQNSFEGFAPQ